MKTSRDRADITGRYWMSLVFMIALLVFLGHLNEFFPKKIFMDSLCGMAGQNPHPFLCGQKIAIHDASVVDLQSLEGISHKKALAIHDFFAGNAQAMLSDVVEIAGIGPKTLTKLSSKFY